MSEPRDIKDIFSHEDFESQTVWAPHSRSLAYIANKKANPIYQRLLDANKKLREVLKKHHNWHLQSKQVACENDFKYDLASEYESSGLCEVTMIALSEASKIEGGE